MKLAELAAEMQVRFVLSHPHNKTISASAQQQKYISDLGGFIEHTFVTCMPMHSQVSPKEIANSIRLVGVKQTVITSDAFRFWNPPRRRSSGCLLPPCWLSTF